MSSLDRSLHRAAENGDIDVCCRLVDEGVRIDGRDNLGQTALHFAADKGHTEVCCCLVDRGANADLQDNWRQSALHVAAGKGHTDVCCGLLDKGANADLQDNRGQSALHIAAHKGDTDLCICLVDRSANVDLQDNYGQSPLHIAAEKGDTDLCICLADRGANVDLQDNLAKSPLHIAAKEGHTDTCCCLVDKGANVELQNHWRKSALHVAAGEGHTEVCRCLVDKGASVDLQDDSRQSALHVAAGKGHTDVCFCLVDKGANVDLQDKSGRSPLHIAAEKGHTDICCRLVDKGANVDLQDHLEESPLHIAAKKGLSDVCRLLVDNVANVDVQDLSKESPLHNATWMCFSDICRLLVEKTAIVNLQNKSDESPLHFAAWNGLSEICRLLVDKGANVNLQHNLGWSPLHVAAEKGHTEVCRCLVDKGADVDLQDNSGRSPLHRASEKGYMDVCCYLLDKGANVDLQDNMLQSPLHFAAKKGLSNVCRLLVDKGAKVDLQDKSAESPLHIAVRKCFCDVCHLLVEKGANINLQHNSEKSPLHMAASRGLSEVCCLLVDKSANVNLLDKSKESPLHIATWMGLSDVCHLLVDKGANVNLPGKDGNTPLHHAAMFDDPTTSVEMCRLLMSHKADPTTRNKAGKTAVEVAAMDSCQRMLKTYAAEFRVAHLAKKKPRTVRLAVVGDEAVGKTQFIETVNSTAVAAKARSLRAPPKPGTVAYLAERTPGIAIKKIGLRHKRKLRVLDFGGQLQFIAGHRPILVTKFGIYLVIVKLEVDLDAMITSAFFWLAFIVATRDPATISGLRPPPIFIVFSHADLMASTAEALKLSRQVYGLLQEKYGKYFTWMDGNPYVCNCRLRSREIERLLEGLEKGHTLVVEEMPEEPVWNGQIRKALKKHRQSFKSSILTLQDYCDFILEQAAFTVFKPIAQELVALTALLDEQADVMMFDCKTEQADRHEAHKSYVVVDPHSMCQNMLKLILSPHKFPGSHLIFPKHGVIEESKLDEALSQAGVDPSAGKALLEHSKVSTPVVLNPGASCQQATTICSPEQGPRHHFFGIHVQHTSMPDNAWVEDGKTKPQAGVQLHCPSIIPVSPAYLPAVQVDLSKQTGGITEDSLIWKSGMIIQAENNVSVLVQRANDSLNVNFIARAEPNHLENCATALGKVVRTASKTADSVTPGSEVQPRYLSPSQLGAFKSPAAVVAYPSEKVIQCYNEKMNLQQGAVIDDPKDVIAVVKAVEPHRCSKIADMSGEGAARVAAEIGDRMTCIELALEIGVDRGPLAEIEGKSDAHYTPQDCRALLMDWWKAQPETAGAVLHQSLVMIGKKDIAERHKGALRVTGADGVADIFQRPRARQHQLLMKKAVCRVAKQLGRTDCIGLGKQLAISGGPLSQIEAKSEYGYSPGDAYDMLNTWLLSMPQEPRKSLYAALVDAGVRSHAEDFERFLLAASVGN